MNSPSVSPFSLCACVLGPGQQPSELLELWQKLDWTVHVNALTVGPRKSSSSVFVISNPIKLNSPNWTNLSAVLFQWYEKCQINKFWLIAVLQTAESAAASMDVEEDGRSYSLPSRPRSLQHLLLHHSRSRCTSHCKTLFHFNNYYNTLCSLLRLQQSRVYSVWNYTSLFFYN